MNINDLDLTIRSENALRDAGITTVESLVDLTWEQLQGLTNAGIKSQSEIVWRCLDLSHGRMTSQRLKYEGLWPERPKNWIEIARKAHKYDSIVEITDA